jgi:predicted transcriptional regulator
MRTTVRLDDELLRETKSVAARRGTTLTSVLEEALREWLARHRRGRRGAREELPLSDAGGEVRAGIDLDDSAGLLERMEQDASP